MNVLVYTTLYPNKIEPTRGVFVKERIVHLAKHHAITVVAPVRYFPFILKSKVDEFELDNNIKVYHPKYFVLPWIAKWTDGFFLLISTFYITFKIINKNKIKIIDGHWGYPDGFSAYLISKVLKIPFIVTLRGSDINVFLKSGLRKILILWYLKQLKHIIVVSASLKDALVKHNVNASKIEVIRNGVDFNKFYIVDKVAARNKLGLHLDKQILLCIGNLVDIKGQDILLNAYKLIESQSRQLIFIGDGDMKEALLRKVQTEFKYSKNITFVGRKAHEEIVYWLNACDLYVLPSRNEGMPNVIYEALACGKPIVATNVGGINEVITTEEVGLLVEPGSFEKLSTGIIVALAKHWDAQLIRSTVEQYTWEITTMKCEEIWRATCE